MCGSGGWHRTGADDVQKGQNYDSLYLIYTYYIAGHTYLSTCNSRYIHLIDLHAIIYQHTNTILYPYYYLAYPLYTPPPC